MLYFLFSSIFILIIIMAEELLVDAVRKNREVSDEDQTKLKNGLSLEIDKRKDEKSLNRILNSKINVPYQCIIYMKRLDNHCDCVIISEMFVLTAGSCVQNLQPTPNPIHFKYPYSEILIILGPHNSVNRVMGVKLHEDYVGGMYNDDADIALIHLMKTQKFNSKLKNIALANDFPHLKATVYASGYEDDDSEDWNSTLNLRGTNLTVVSHKRCTEMWRHYNEDVKITRKHICAQFTKKNYVEEETPCHRDSGFNGGPLILLKSEMLVGIDSFAGEDCEDPDRPPDVFTYIPAYVPWIVNSIKEIESISNHSTSTVKEIEL